jgi:hypothetical protein
MAESVTLHKRRWRWLLASIVITFVLLRGWLHQFPNTDLNVGAYNIHHLFTGLLLILLGGVPLAVLQGASRWLDLATVVFGVGLSMALDEWVFLIATEGSNQAYLTPVSWRGAIVMIALACGYVGVFRIIKTKL